MTPVNKEDFNHLLDQIYDKTEPFKLTSIKPSEEKWCPTKLIVGPGGLKGFLELGGLARLEEEKILTNIDTFIGVSVGSIICLLRIAGYTWYEIVDIGIDFDLYPDWSKFRLSDIINKRGFINHDKLRNVLRPALISKYGLVPNLQQLYMFSGKVYIAVTYNLSLGKTCYLSYQTHPHLSVIEAAIASSTIPFVFQSYIYRDNIYIDGALGNPYPINIVDTGGCDVLGIYVTLKNRKKKLTDLPTLVDKVIHSPMIELRKEIIKNSSNRCRHLGLYYDVTDIMEVAINSDQKINMFESGYDQTTLFINSFKETIVIDHKTQENIPYVPRTLETVLMNVDGTSKELIELLSNEKNDIIISVINKTLESYQLTQTQPSLDKKNLEKDLPKMLSNISEKGNGDALIQIVNSVLKELSEHPEIFQK